MNQGERYSQTRYPQTGQRIGITAASLPRCLEHIDCTLKRRQEMQHASGVPDVPPWPSAPGGSDLFEFF